MTMRFYGVVSSAQQSAVPSTCSFTLEDYSGLDPSQQYPTVSGQNFSVTNEEFSHQEVFVAGTSLSGIPIDWPTDEIRIVQLATNNSSLGYYEAFGAGSARYDNSARLAITNSTFNKNIVVAMTRDENAGGTWGSLTYGSNGSGFQGVEYSGSILNSTPRAGLTTNLAIGVRGDGHVFFYADGVEQTSVYLDGTLQPQAAFDFFDPASDNLIVAGQLGPMTSSSSMVPFTATVEGEIITTGFTDTYPAGVKDWCGNPL